MGRDGKEGDHYSLAFDKPRNLEPEIQLVWDNILGLHLFPPEIAEQEIELLLART